MPLTKSEKTTQLKRNPECYVCKALGLPDADFDGYLEWRHIDFDHFKAKALVGSVLADNVANQLPVHAYPGGSTFRDENYMDKGVRRNCHLGKGLIPGSTWVEKIKIQQAALKLRIAEDLMEGRKKTQDTYNVVVKWDKKTATYKRRKYPIVEQKFTTDAGTRLTWRSFSTVVNPQLLWNDADIQNRPVDRTRAVELALHLKTNPLLSPILCRLQDKRLLVFDGNHRLCAFILAHGKEKGIPITVFDGPDHDQFLAVVGQAHNQFRQLAYQFTEYALKYSMIGEAEIKDAMEKWGASASEKLTWEGFSKKDVKTRILGSINRRLDEAGGWREAWKQDHKVTDASWNKVIVMYAKTTAEEHPFNTENWHRNNELENLALWAGILDEEVMKECEENENLRKSLKSKWWARCHSRLSARFAESVRDILDLGDAPKHPAYTPKWNRQVQNTLRKAFRKWAQAPIWTNHECKENNEKDIDDALNSEGFTQGYLFG